ncbi:MAG: DUF2167 domain-containing protein [Bryobacteraceae bacterium]|jgi:uncharacterized membrane-anchored protein
MLPWLFLLAAAGAAPVPEIHWQFGPRTVTFAGVGALSLPQGMVSADKAETRRFLEATGNPPAGDELVVVAPTSLDWFLVFSFEPYQRLGLSKAEPTVEEIVAALKRGNWEANAARRKAGRETLDVLGWRDKPRYDAKTALLEWSLDTQESGGRKDANRFWLYLTRGGVLTVELVSEEPRFAAASQQARALLGHLGIVEQEAYNDPNSHDWLSVSLGIIAAVLPALGFLVLYLLQRRKKRGAPQA